MTAKLASLSLAALMLFSSALHGAEIIVGPTGTTSEPYVVPQGVSDVSLSLYLLPGAGIGGDSFAGVAIMAIIGNGISGPIMVPGTAAGTPDAMYAAAGIDVYVGGNSVLAMGSNMTPSPLVLDPVGDRVAAVAGNYPGFWENFTTVTQRSLLAVVHINTMGVPLGDYPFSLTGHPKWGDTYLGVDENFDEIFPAITNGIIRVTPEPSTSLLFGLGLVGMAAWRVRRRAAR